MVNASQSATPASPQTKATREDWVRVAMDTLVSDGVEAVKVLPLADRLGVARSSFYWYFTNREELLNLLLEMWADTNTRAIVESAAVDTADITGGVLSLFACWTDESLFDSRLDFAIREWARRSDDVQAAVRRADDLRVEAIAGMFERHGYPAREAFVRARVLYFMQIGYYALELGESLETRLDYAADYVAAYTGVDPDPAAVAAYVASRRA
jgi:AcrR family transcriptional regulator